MNLLSFLKLVMGKERKRKAKKTASTSKKKGHTSTVHVSSEDVSADFCDSENSEIVATKKQIQKGKPNYTIEDLLKQVDECLDNFNFELAVKFCERALDIEPDNVQVLETAGAVYLETGDIHKAKECFENAVNISPEDGYSKYMNLGQLLVGQESVNAYSKGIQLMLSNKDDTQEAASSNPYASPTEISTAFCSLAEIYLTDECFKEEAATKCSEYCHKALEYDPSNPEAFQLMASCLLSQEKMDEAREMLKKSLELWQGRDEELPKAPPPPYETRIATSKLLIELEIFETAGSVLEELVEECDEVAQVTKTVFFGVVPIRMAVPHH
ncbi:uncharacterized protein [Montipora foliosa]|uniref:uncharacterized protein isoform X2 n=1 Tax=Montipora foliosa TaxID=591990 RepID=UPI0035F1A275